MYCRVAGGGIALTQLSYIYLFCKSLGNNEVIKIKELQKAKLNNVAILLRQPRGCSWTNQIADTVAKSQM